MHTQRATRKKASVPKTFGCPVGRPLNRAHATCKTCPIDCSGWKGKGKKACSSEEIVNTRHEGKTIVTTAYLYSPNHWHGRPLAVYMAEKRKWRQFLDGTWALWGRQGTERRQVVVTRQVTQEEHLINDDDNLWFSLKPVLDCLKHYGVIVDDAREYIAETEITQTIVDRQLVTIEVRPAAS
jgi:hypothetical protein